MRACSCPECCKATLEEHALEGLTGEALMPAAPSDQPLAARSVTQAVARQVASPGRAGRVLLLTGAVLCCFVLCCCRPMDPLLQPAPGAVGGSASRLGSSLSSGLMHRSDVP